MSRPTVPSSTKYCSEKGKGSSRGPWLLSGGKEANGVKVVEDDDMACSPHFIEDMKQENIY